MIVPFSVLKGKLFGDAMRASAIRMGVDPIEAIPFFRNVEQLFDVYDVPAELRPVLVRPFLNDKAKAVVGKLGPEVLGDYERLSYLLMCILIVLTRIERLIARVTWRLLLG